MKFQNQEPLPENMIEELTQGESVKTINYVYQ